MYLLDTNVLSELRKTKAGRCERAVLDWSVQASDQPMFISAMSVLEIEMGVHKVRRHDPEQLRRLSIWLRDNVLVEFAGHILPVDESVALAAAPMHVPDPRSARDALIAATALVHNLTVVTRNIRDFRDTGAKLLNPWQFSPE